LENYTLEKIYQKGKHYKKINFKEMSYNLYDNKETNIAMHNI